MVDVHEDGDWSLNAGAETEEERQIAEATQHEKLFEEIVPGEVPELREDVHLLAALEAQLQDLHYLRQDMLRTHGMTQSFALEGQRLLPGFDGARALGYYTQQPSATRYKVALEEVNKGIWALIAAAVAAVIAALVKFISWWRGRGKDGKGPAAAAQTARTNLKQLDEVEHHFDELTQQLRAGHITQQGRQISMATLIEDLWGKEDPRYQRMLRFLHEPHPVFHDIIHRGVYTRSFRSLSHDLPAVVDALRLKLTQLEKIAQLDRRSFLSSDKAVNTRELELISKPVEVFFGSGHQTLMQAADQLSSVRLQVLTQEHTDRLTPDQMVAAVIEAYRSADVVRFFEEQQEVLDVFTDFDTQLAKLKKTAGDLSQDGSAGHNSEGVAQHLREVIFKVAQDVNGYRKLFAELSNYGAYLEHLANQTIGFAQEIETQLFSLAERGKVELPQDWQDRARSRKASRIDALFKAAAPKAD